MELHGHVIFCGFFRKQTGRESTLGYTRLVDAKLMLFDSRSENIFPIIDNNNNCLSFCKQYFVMLLENLN